MIRTYVKRPNTGDTLDTSAYGPVTVTRVPDITGRTIVVRDALTREWTLTRAPNGYWTRVTVTDSDRAVYTRVAP